MTTPPNPIDAKIARVEAWVADLRDTASKLEEGIARGECTFTGQINPVDRYRQQADDRRLCT